MSTLSRMPLTRTSLRERSDKFVLKQHEESLSSHVISHADLVADTSEKGDFMHELWN